MHPNELEVTNDQIKRWYEESVAPAMREIAESPPEHMPQHCSFETGIKDIYVVRHILRLADEDVKYPDGGNDGGVDVFHEDRDTETGAPYFNLLQSHAPALDKMERGLLSGRPVSEKFREDAEQVLNTLFGPRARRLNATAEEVFRRIQEEIQNVGDDPNAPPITIAIRAISLQRIDAESIRAIEELRAALPARIPTALSARVRVEILDPITPADLINREMRRTHEPREVAFEVQGNVAIASPDRGPFLVFVRAHSVVEAYEKYGDNLLDANLRHWLKERTAVNKDIKRELSTVRGLRNFHMKNNGLVIWCSGFRHVSKNNAVHLKSPQIVNGGQTVLTMFHTWRELGSRPPSHEHDEWRKGFKDTLLVPAKVLKEVPQLSVDDVAVASNSQNPLSARTLHSARPVMRILAKKFAAVEPAWFLETKDGEWDALRQEKNERLLQSKTGKRASVFKDGRTTRKASNEDVGVALLAFYGFPRSAKKTVLWSENGFECAFMKSVKDDKWASFASGLKWGDDALRAVLEPITPGAHQCLLAYLVWSFWRNNTLPESKYLVLAYDDRARKDIEFKNKYYDERKGWLVGSITDEEIAQTKHGSEPYWTERVAKAAYLVLVFQTMRILQRRYGCLTDDVCRQILKLPELSSMASRNDVAVEFRTTSITHGPVTTIAKCLLLACKYLHAEHEKKVESLLSPQQDLLRDDWIVRLSDAVDGVLDRLSKETFRVSTKLDPDGELVGDQALDSLLPGLGNSPSPSD